MFCKKKTRFYELYYKIYILEKINKIYITWFFKNVGDILKKMLILFFIVSLVFTSCSKTVVVTNSPTLGETCIRGYCGIHEWCEGAAASLNGTGICKDLPMCGDGICSALECLGCWYESKENCPEDCK
jgi:hypothetical protein